MMKKPSVFRLIDFLSFGLPGILSTLLLAYVVFVSEHAPGFAGFVALLSTVAAVFWFVYGVILYKRYAVIKKISYVTSHGIIVLAGATGVSKEEVERLTSLAISCWEDVTRWPDCYSAITDSQLWVTFKSGPAALHSSFGKLAGYVVGNTVVVGYAAERALDDTAFRHELGHVIHREWTGYADNTACHQYMAAHGLK